MEKRKASHPRGLEGFVRGGSFAPLNTALTFTELCYLSASDSEIDSRCSS